MKIDKLGNSNPVSCFLNLIFFLQASIPTSDFRLQPIALN